jgi:hypothetical protein
MSQSVKSCACSFLTMYLCCYALTMQVCVVYIWILVTQLTLSPCVRPSSLACLSTHALDYTVYGGVGECTVWFVIMITHRRFCTTDPMYSTAHPPLAPGKDC